MEGLGGAEEVAELSVSLTGEPDTSLTAVRRKDGIAPGGDPTTEHRVFDEAFQIKGSDPVFASSLLAAGVRQKLLASRLPRLEEIVGFDHP